MSRRADRVERDLLLRVLGALLREDVCGLRTRTTEVVLADGRWLRLPGTGTGVPGGSALLLPVTEDGFQARYTARLPLLRREDGGEELTGCDAVLGALRELADPADRAGFDAFAEECRRTADTVRLHEDARGPVHRTLTDRYGPDPARWHGHRGTLAFDTLAAHLDHPVYPTSRGRAGLGEPQLRAFAPEFHPRYRPRWIVLPRTAVTERGVADHPRWPTPSRLGLPSALDTDHLALPVHPLTRARALHDALRDAGLAEQAVLARRPYLDLVPTLSMRTGALAAVPTLHLKLPLATSTLGLRNRRTVKPGTLVDGEVGQRLLERVLDREPRFRGRVLLADETVHLHAGHELLAALLRTLPDGLDDAVVVPMAALTAEVPGGKGSWCSTGSPTGSTGAIRSRCWMTCCDCCSTGRPRCSATASRWSRTSRTSPWSWTTGGGAVRHGSGCCSRTTTARGSTPPGCGRPSVDRRRPSTTPAS